MEKTVDDKIAPALVNILSDGFNRALNALETAGAIDATELRSDYMPGSEYYLIVTQALETTAGYALPAIRKMIEECT